MAKRELPETNDHGTAENNDWMHPQRSQSSSIFMIAVDDTLSESVAWHFAHTVLKLSTSLLQLQYGSFTKLDFDAHDRKCCSRSITLFLKKPRTKDIDENCTPNARRTSVRIEGLCLLTTIAVSATHPAVRQWFVFTLRRQTHLIRAIAQHRELGYVLNCLILAVLVNAQTASRPRTTHPEIRSRREKPLPKVTSL